MLPKFGTHKKGSNNFLAFYGALEADYFAGALGT